MASRLTLRRVLGHRVPDPIGWIHVRIEEVALEGMFWAPNMVDPWKKIRATAPIIAVDCNSEAHEIRGGLWVQIQAPVKLRHG